MRSPGDAPASTGAGGAAAAASPGAASIQYAA
jgi:hypothetical protein